MALIDGTAARTQPDPRLSLAAQAGAPVFSAARLAVPESLRTATGSTLAAKGVDSMSAEALEAEAAPWSAGLDLLTREAPRSGLQQAVREAQARVQDLEDALHSTQARFEQARVESASVQADARQADDRAAGLRAQFELEDVSRSLAQAKVDQWQADLDAASALVRKAEAALADGHQAMAEAGGHKNKGRRRAAQQGAQYRIDTADQQLRAARAQVEQARAELAEARAEAVAPASSAQIARNRWDAAAHAAAMQRAQAAAAHATTQRAMHAELAVHTQLAEAQTRLLELARADAAMSGERGTGPDAAGGAMGLVLSTERALDMTRATIVSQEQAIADAQARTEAQRQGGKPLDEKAVQAEATATQLKSEFDVAQLALTRVQAEVSARQGEFDAATAAVEQGQHALDAAHQAMVLAGMHKKKKNRRRAQAAAQAQIDAASRQLATARQGIAPAEQALAQAKALAAPPAQAAQLAQARWEGAAQLAATARGHATAQFEAARQAGELEVAAQARLGASQWLLIQLGEAEAQVRAAGNAERIGTAAELSDVVAAKDEALTAALQSLIRQEQSVARTRDNEARERAQAVPLQAQAAAAGLIVDNLQADAQAAQNAHESAQQEVTARKADFEAAGTELKDAQAALVQAEFNRSHVSVPSKGSGSVLAMLISPVTSAFLSGKEQRAQQKRLQAATDSAQAKLEAAQQRATSAQLRFDAAVSQLARAERTAAPLRQIAEETQLSQQIAGNGTSDRLTQLAAQQAWTGLASPLYQAADATLATAQERVAHAASDKARAMAALAGATSDAAASATLAEQAQQLQAWADEYRTLAVQARRAAQAVDAQGLERDERAVAATAPQLFSVWLQGKTAGLAQEYDLAKAEVGVRQDDFERALQVAASAAPAADAARNAMRDLEQEVSAAFVMPSLRTPMNVVTSSARQALWGGPQNPRDVLASMFSPGNPVQALAVQMQAQEHSQLEQQLQQDPEGILIRWEQQLAGLGGTAKLRALDDLAQHKEQHQELAAARRHVLETAQAAQQGSEVAMARGEVLQDQVLRADRLGQVSKAAQTALDQAIQAASDAVAQQARQAVAGVHAAEAEQAARQSLLHALQGLDRGAREGAATLRAQAQVVADPGVARLLHDQADLLEGHARADGAPMVAALQTALDLAAQALGTAQANAGALAETAHAMNAFAAEQRSATQEVNQHIDDLAETLGTLRADTAMRLQGLGQLLDWSQAVQQEDQERVQYTKELHAARLQQDEAERKALKARKDASLRTLLAAVAAAAIFIATAGSAAPAIASVFEGTALATGSAAVPAVTAAATTVSASGAVATTVSVVTPAIAAVPAGSLAWAGTALSWAGAGALGNMAQQAFNMAIGKAKTFSWQDVGVAAITQGITGGLVGAGGRAMGPQLYGKIRSAVAGPSLESMVKRVGGVLSLQVALKTLGLRDDINLLEAASAGASLGAIVQASSLLGPALTNTVAGQSLLSLTGRLVGHLVLGTPIDVAKLVSGSLGRGVGVMAAGWTSEQVTQALALPIQAPPAGVPSRFQPSALNAASTASSPLSNWPGAAVDQGPLTALFTEQPLLHEAAA